MFFRLAVLLLAVTTAFAFWSHDTTFSGGIFSPRSGHTSIKEEGEEMALIYGGHVINGYAAPVSYFPNEVWSFNRNTNTFHETIVTGLVPSSRTFHGAVNLQGGDMLVWGGGSIVGGSTFLPADTNIWIYHRLAGTWQQIVPHGTVPSGRLGHAMVRIGTKIYVFGGIVPLPSGDCCGFLNDMYSYDIPSNTWTQLFPTGTIPSARGHSGVLTRNGVEIWLQGGEGNDFAIERGLFKYQLGSNSWHQINDMDVNQRESQLFNHIGDNFLALSGDHPGLNYYNLLDDTNSYFVPSNTWLNLTDFLTVSPPAGKRMPSVAFVDRAEIWFFGANTAFDITTGIETNNNQVWNWKFL